MSVQCPNCGADLEQDFGVVNCPQCASVLVVDVDGQVQVQPPPALEVAVEAESPVKNEMESADEDSPSQESPVEYVDLDLSPPAEVAPVEENLNSLQEISDFGNAELSQSPLSYTMTIEGIDLGDIREAVTEALSHPKFKWNVRELVASISSGVLILENIPPAKASVLAHRLRSIKIKVTWRQNVYS